MKKFVIAGTLVSALTLGGVAFAQTTPAAQQPAAGATKQTPTTKQGTTKSGSTKQGAPAATAPTGAEQAAPAAGDQTPAPKKRARAAKSSAGENAGASHTAPKAQPGTTGEANAPGAMALGSVHIPAGVKANGEALPAGTYQVRLTADEAKPDAKGSSEKLERWVEFVKGGKAVGKEVVSIVPANEAKLVQKDTPPASGGSKVETLKGGDYVRLWINKGGNYYLVHLVKG